MYVKVKYYLLQVNYKKIACGLSNIMVKKATVGENLTSRQGCMPHLKLMNLPLLCNDLIRVS